MLVRYGRTPVTVRDEMLEEPYETLELANANPLR
jgi:hypothetical protein